MEKDSVRGRWTLEMGCKCEGSKKKESGKHQHSHPIPSLFEILPLIYPSIRSDVMLLK